ncbi:MAG TPA: cbb3-type cytochrome c oxidase subunit I [Noviherbaspirillum sp.]|nr:cbb3-type cytochrome c oxidase subunit I [Noviherbaspirillum sp.]
MDAVLRARPEVRRLVAGWFLLALLALALSTACAVMLVAARIPLPGGIVASVSLFRSALVLHVGLAVVVWFLSCAAGLWTLAAGEKASGARLLAMALAYAGVLAMMLALFLGTSAPVLANYIPVLDNPVFLLGLGWFLGGIALCGATSIAGILRQLKGKNDTWRVAALLSIAVTTIAVLALAIPALSSGVPTDAAGFEMMAWGPGHLLQFAHVLLLMGVWCVLGEQALGRAPASRPIVMALLLSAALPVLAAPFIYLAHPIGSAEFRHAFTLLMAWGIWPAAMLLAVHLFLQLWRAGRAVWMSPRNWPLLLSILLFLLGCAFGASIRGESTMVPAHYHGTVGAVTLAYMALGYRLLSSFGFTALGGRLIRWQPALYGAGLFILAVALAWSGWLGVPRKTLHVDVVTQYPAYFAAMGLAGLGGSLAISGAALFVFNIVRVLRTRRVGIVQSAPGRQWSAAWALMFVFILGSGALVIFLPGSFGGTQISALRDPARHAAQKRDEEIARQFAEGAALLSAKQYQAAAGVLHRVLELAPQMPEAQVNMGFAMIGLEKYAMARDFFDTAINLRTTQINAYYGLAIALEGLGDLEGALGAMRTYLHRSKPDDPFARKANAAIWEWEEQLAGKQSENPPTAAVLESEKGSIRYPIPEKKLN